MGDRGDPPLTTMLGCLRTCVTNSLPRSRASRTSLYSWMYTLTPSFCVSVEECGCEGVGNTGVRVWESVGVSVGAGQCRYVGVGVWRSVGAGQCRYVGVGAGQVGM